MITGGREKIKWLPLLLLTKLIFFSGKAEIIDADSVNYLRLAKRLCVLLYIPPLLWYSFHRAFPEYNRGWRDGGTCAWKKPNQRGDVHQINNTLFSFDQTLLGSTG